MLKHLAVALAVATLKVALTTAQYLNSTGIPMFLRLFRKKRIAAQEAQRQAVLKAAGQLRDEGRKDSAVDDCIRGQEAWQPRSSSAPLFESSSAWRELRDIYIKPFRVCGRFFRRHTQYTLVDLVVTLIAACIFIGLWTKGFQLWVWLCLW
ncbi:hypothetical protein LTR50_007576 [Elasticomyces elasticus]|nr:hypothetical protein LTR50_007576 [Elasticomyces elasticus]